MDSFTTALVVTTLIMATSTGVVITVICKLIGRKDAEYDAGVRALKNDRHSTYAVRH